MHSEQTRWQRQLQREQAWCFATEWTAPDSAESQQGNEEEKNNILEIKFQQKGDPSTEEKARKYSRKKREI